MCISHIPTASLRCQYECAICTYMFWLDPILVPLARLAIRKGWSFPVVEQRLRHAYITAAKSMSDGVMTDSRISVVTGLQRRDIARLRKEAAPPRSPRQPLAEIIARWWDDPNYDPDGIPIQGAEGNFTSLARGVRKDVHPRTFLDVLIENGAVEERADEVVLKTRSYRPLPGSDDQLAYLADNVGDHLSASVSNVLESQGNYDMAVHYDGLSAEAVRRIEAHYRERMTQVAQELDTMVRALPETAHGSHRFRAGGYLFNDLDCEAVSHDP